MQSVRISTSCLRNSLENKKNWKESTSTSPLGRHLGHFMAFVKYHGIPESDADSYKNFEGKRQDLIKIHVALINYCLLHG